MNVVSIETTNAGNFVRFISSEGRSCNQAIKRLHQHVFCWWLLWIRMLL